MKITSTKIGILIGLCVWNIAYGATVDSLKAHLNDTGKQVFETRIYEKKFSESNAMPWIDAVTEVGIFVNGSQNMFVTPALRTIYKNLKDVNDNLMKVIQATYNNIFKEETPNTDAIDEQVKQFKRIQKDILGVESKLNSLPRYVIPAQEEVRVVLIALANALKANISRAGNHIEEEIKLRPKASHDAYEEEVEEHDYDFSFDD